MNRRQLITIILALAVMAAQAQVVIVSGNLDPSIGREYYRMNFNVLDNFTGASVNDVKAYLMTKDSVVIDSLQSNNGRCSFKVKRDKAFRSCIIKMVHPDYQTLLTAHSLKQVGKQNYYSLPDQFMKRKKSLPLSSRFSTFLPLTNISPCLFSSVPGICLISASSIEPSATLKASALYTKVSPR